MKIFTHVFVIYDNGWKFEWKARKDIDGYYKFTGTDVMLWLCILYIMFG